MEKRINNKIVWPNTPLVKLSTVGKKAERIKRSLATTVEEESHKEISLPHSSQKHDHAKADRSIGSKYLADIRRRVQPTVGELTDDQIDRMVALSNSLLRSLAETSELYAPAGTTNKARIKRHLRLREVLGHAEPWEQLALGDALGQGAIETGKDDPLKDAEPGFIDKIVGGAAAIGSGVWNSMNDTSKAVVTATGALALTPLALRLARLRGQRVSIDTHGGSGRVDGVMTGSSYAGSDGKIIGSGMTVLQRGADPDAPARMIDGGVAMSTAASIPVDVPFKLLQMGRLYNERVSDAKWRTFATVPPSQFASGDVGSGYDYFMPPVSVNDQGVIVSGPVIGAASAMARHELGMDAHLSITQPFLDEPGGLLGQGNWFKDAAKGMLKKAGPALKVGLKVAKALPVVGNVLMVADLAASMAGTDLGTLAGKAYDAVTGGGEKDKQAPTDVPKEQLTPAQQAAINKGKRVMSLDAQLTAAAAIEASEKKGSMSQDQLDGLAIDLEVARQLQQLGYSDSQILELTGELDDMAGGNPLEGAADSDDDFALGQGGYSTQQMGRIFRAFRKTGSRYSKTTTRAAKVKRAKFGSASSSAAPLRPGMPESTVKMTSDARRAFFETVAKSRTAQITLGTVGLGTIFLGAWHVSRWKDKARDKQLIVDRIGLDSADRMFELAEIADADGANGLTSAERLEFLGYLSDLETTGVAAFSSRRASMRAAAIDAQRKAGEVANYEPAPDDVTSPVLSSNSGMSTVLQDGTMSQDQVSKIAASGMETAGTDSVDDVAQVTNPILQPFIGVIPAPVLKGIQKIAPVILAIGGTALLMTLIDRAVQKAKKVDNKQSLSIPVSLI